ncbi:MAG: hypothetical protein ABSF98_00645 [Bryobacteraceae bacterium]
MYKATLGLEAHTSNRSKGARARGESEQRLYCLEAWREAPFYTERERAALAWTEAVTVVTDGFSDAELANLTLAIIAINGWNRPNVNTVHFGIRPPIGHAARAAFLHGTDRTRLAPRVPPTQTEQY